MAIAVGDIYRARLVASDGQQTAFVVLHYQCLTIAGTSADDTAFATAFNATCGADFKAALNAQATFRGVDVQRVYPLPVLPTATNSSLAGAGGVAGDQLPTQTSGLIFKKTALAGRKFRGRSYIPFPSKSNMTSTGDPTAGYVTLLQAIAADLSASIVAGGGGNTAGMAPCIYHRAAHTITVLTACGARTAFATQRRRGAFGRPNAPPF